MSVLSIKTDNKGAVDYYTRLIESLQSVQNETKYAVVNTAQDPKTEEFIFPFVDEGRGEVVAKNSPKKFLKIPIGPDEFIFKKSVGPSRPRRIKDTAFPRVLDSLHGPLLLKVTEAASDNAFIDGEGIREAIQLSKKAVIEAFQDACRKTIVSRSFDRDAETPRLIDSFVIVEDK